MVNSEPREIQVNGGQKLMAFHRSTPVSNPSSEENDRWKRFLKRLQSHVWFCHLGAGGIAGAMSRTTTAPLDRLKIFSQVHPQSFGIVRCLKYMIREGGVWSLWRGNGVNVIKIIPESALKFTVYEKAKRVIRGSSRHELGLGERFLAGSCAGGVAQTVMYPMEVLKTRLALRKSGEFGGIRDAAFKMYAREGLRSFYRGYLPNVMGSVPYGGIDLAIYETLKRRYVKHFKLKEEPRFLVLLMCCSISSTVGQCCIYPMTLVRTRLQAGVTTETQLIEIFKSILRNEGIRGLYRGLSMNICKVLPSVSINYLVYEFITRNLGLRMS